MQLQVIFAPFFSMKKISTLYTWSVGLSLLLIACLSACIQRKEIQDIVKVPDSQFHGVNIGATPKEVMVAEQGNKLGEKSDGDTFISYEFELDEGEHYMVGYSFEEGKLYDIEADFFLEDAARAEELFAQFKDFYTLKYGESHVEEGYTVWNDKDKDKQVTVSLVDQSSEQKKGGKLSLTIFKINY